MSNGVRKLPGIDVRTKGGYVVMPPSFVYEEKDGKEYEGHYEWRKTKEGELMQLNGKPLTPVPDFVKQAFRRDLNRVSDVFELSGAIIDGSRNDTLFRLASSLRARHCTPFEIEAALVSLNDSRCSPPLPIQEVRQIAKSAGRYLPGPTKDYPRPKAWNGERVSPEEYYDRKEARFVKLSGVERKEIDWLFTGRIAKGAFTILQGDPGEGKSTIAAALTTMLTSGNAPEFWGMNTDGPRNVIWLTKEESLEHSVAPRLERMGADLDRIHALSMAMDEDGVIPGEFLLDAWGVQQLRELIEATEAAMMVLDPLIAFFDPSKDMHRQNETRSVLNNLIQVGFETGCVPLGIVHQSKAKNSNPLLNIVGSIDFGAAARIAYMVGHDPDDKQRKAVVTTKNNYGPHAEPLGFAIIDGGAVEWDEHTDLNADRLNEPPSTKVAREKNQACREWLENELAFGQHEVNSLVQRAKEQEFSRTRVFEVAAVLGVSRGYKPKKGGKGAAWWAKKGYDWSQHVWDDSEQDPFATP